MGEDKAVNKIPKTEEIRSVVLFVLGMDCVNALVVSFSSAGDSLPEPTIRHVVSHAFLRGPARGGLR